MKTPLGQNFLVDQQIARKIVASADPSKKDNILEIGPGKGILTEHLRNHAGKILAVEIDKELASSLAEKYKDIKVIQEDILKLNLPRLIDENNFQDYKVIANLPYYITSKIIRLLLETKYPPEDMTLMVQKEVGERIIAFDGKESRLSVSVKFYAEPKILFAVPRDKFLPVPAVDSVVIKIKRKRTIPDVDTKKFFALVRAGFSAKRKMLANNLAASLQIPKENISETLKKAGIEPAVRAEKLSLDNWLRLYRVFNP